MPDHPQAGKPAPPSSLTNIPRLVSAYYANSPDPGIPTQLVSFGTSGHRGSSLKGSFNEAHVLAVCQAICDYRALAGIDGPLFMGMDTHALSEAGFTSALEVLAGNRIAVMVDHRRGYTPTPVISFSILAWNRGHKTHAADGIIITPSHNPPDNGGIKYNPPHGGPAGTQATQQIENRANELLKGGNRDVKRKAFHRALKADTTRWFDYTTPYVDALADVVDMQAIADAGIGIGVDPLGGAAVAYWPQVADHYGINIEVVSAPASADQKETLKKLSADQVRAGTLAGDPIVAKLTCAPGNGQAIGGLKVVTENGWFAARPSGTEEIYKIYTESFKGLGHLHQIQEEARQMVSTVFAAAGAS